MALTDLCETCAAIAGWRVVRRGVLGARGWRVEERGRPGYGGKFLCMFHLNDASPALGLWN